MDSQFITSGNAVKIVPGNFSTESPLLGQKLFVLCEPSTAKEPTVDVTPFQPVSEAQVIDRLGAGSPGHIMYRYLSLLNIPVLFAPQEYSTTTAPTATEHEVTITGTVTENAEHKYWLNGRDFTYNVFKDDTPTIVAQRIADSINGLNAAPASASATLGVLTITSKWKGLTSNGMKSRFTYGDQISLPAGLTYAIVVTAGTGTPDIQPALDAMGSTWNTIIVNPYGEPVFETLEAFIGKPSDTVQLGLWGELKAMPAQAFFGSNLSDSTAIAALTGTEARKAQLANVSVSTPNSEWFPFEAAASGATLFGQVTTENPQMGVVGKALPLGIAPYGGVGDMKDTDGRNVIVKLGHSTSEWVNGEWIVTDLVTTYHPDGETFPKYRHVRDVNVFMNLLYSIKELQKKYIGKIATSETTVTSAENMVSISTIKTDVKARVYSLANLGLIATPEFSFAKATISINPSKRINFGIPAQVTSEITQTDGSVIVDFYVSA